MPVRRVVVVLFLLNAGPCAGEDGFYYQFEDNLRDAGDNGYNGRSFPQEEYRQGPQDCGKALWVNTGNANEFGTNAKKMPKDDEPWTLSFYVRVQQVAARTAFIHFGDCKTGGKSKDQRLGVSVGMLSRNSGGQWAPTVNVHIGQNNEGRKAASNVRDKGRWYHVVAIYEEGQQKIKLWVDPTRLDGGEDLEFDFDDPLQLSNPAKISIGRVAGCLGEPTQGVYVLDDARLVPRVERNLDALRCGTQTPPDPPTPAPTTAVPPTPAPSTPIPPTPTPPTPLPSTPVPPTTPPPASPTPSPQTPTPPPPPVVSPTPAPPGASPPPAPPTPSPQTPAPQPPPVASPTPAPPVAPTPSPQTPAPPPPPVASATPAPLTPSPQTPAPPPAASRTPVPAPVSSPAPVPRTAMPTTAMPPPTLVPPTASPTTAMPPPTPAPATDAPSTTAPPMLVPVTPQPRPPTVVPEAQKEQLRDVGKAAGAASVLAGSAAGNAGKLAIVRSFGCDVDDVDLGFGEPLDFEFHPTGVEIGEGPARYLVGAVVMNVVLFVGFALFSFGLAAAVRGVRGVAMPAAMGLTKCPGVTLIPFAFLLPGTSLVSCRLLFFPEVAGAGGAALGAFGLVYCIGLPGVIYMKVLREVPMNAHEELDPAVCRGKTPQAAGAFTHDTNAGAPSDDGDGEPLTGWKRALYIFALGDRVWVSSLGDDPYFCDKRGLFFDGYRSGKSYMLLVEFGVTILLSLFSVWKPGSDLECGVRNVIITLLLLGFFFAVLVATPFIAPLENIVALVLAGGTALAVLLMSVGIGFNHAEDSAAYLISGYFLLISAYLVLVKAVWDILLYLWDLWTSRKAALRERQRAAARVFADATDNGGGSEGASERMLSLQEVMGRGGGGSTEDAAAAGENTDITASRSAYTPLQPPGAEATRGWSGGGGTLGGDSSSMFFPDPRSPASPGGGHSHSHSHFDTSLHTANASSPTLAPLRPPHAPSARGGAAPAAPIPPYSPLSPAVPPGVANGFTHRGSGRGTASAPSHKPTFPYLQSIRAPDRNPGESWAVGSAQVTQM